MVISWSFLVKDLNVLVHSLFVNLEVEVRLSLNLREYILSNAFSLLLSKLFFESESIKFLLYKGSNTVLNLLQVGVIIFVNLTNAVEDSFLLLWASQL